MRQRSDAAFGTEATSSVIDPAAPQTSVNNITRHMILVRHGQYDETYKEDEKRILTPLGRDQARLTGRRIAHMMAHDDEKSAKVTIKSVHVSDMARAKETADLIVEEIEAVTGKKVERTKPDPNLNEGRPCHVIPSRKPMNSQTIHTDSSRIEAAYRKYFHRADEVSTEKKKR